MQCLEQYDAGLVQLERDGYLDDPTYIENLTRDHPLRVRENVFAFSMSCASLQMLQMLAMTLDPLDQPNPGEQLYHFVGGYMEPAQYGVCHPECLFPGLIARGDQLQNKGGTVGDDRASVVAQSFRASARRFHTTSAMTGLAPRRTSVSRDSP
jgi:hypothetical protein